MRKAISVVFYGYETEQGGWQPSRQSQDPVDFVAALALELQPLGIDLQVLREPKQVLAVRGYGDYLNTVRLRSPKDSIGNLCLGHIIGPSPNCDLLEDIRRGISRVAFAPETIEPEGSHKVVCHNCGCGC